MADRESWLNGWQRSRTRVHIFNSVRCAGCGVCYGIVTCGGPEPTESPPEPDWPFNEADCPICKLAAEVPIDRLEQRLVAMRQRQAAASEKVGSDAPNESAVADGSTSRAVK